MKLIVSLVPEKDRNERLVGALEVLDSTNFSKMARILVLIDEALI